MPGPAYSKPPIVEAVFEIRFAESLSPRELERLRDRFSSNFPKIELQQKIDIEVTNAGVNAKATPVGFKMTSSNALDIVLMQVNQFGSSRMAPYEGWEKFIRTAKANYDDFTKIVGRKTITRIACRFINRVDIPVAEMEGVDILEFVRFGVAMPEELSKTIGPFSVAANFIVDNVKILAQCGLTPPALLDHLSLMLDIDSFVDSDIKPHKDTIWEVASTLRSAKNRVFETSITDRLRVHFQ
jgi:uncharacterized protein (TIGR04255 family)